MSSSTMVLPFVVEDSGRTKAFSSDLEVAALLCIAEAARKKKPGIFGGVTESLVFISKLHYPIWAIPWEDRCLLIDGAKVFSAKLLYFKPPNVEAFVEHLKRSTVVAEFYQSALMSHAETFSEFTSHEEITVDGFLTDKELLSDIIAYIKEGKGQIDGTASLLQPIINRENAVNIGARILEHYNKLQSEIKGLQFAIDFVNEETKKHVNKLQEELEKIRERYEALLSDVRTQVERRIGELERERDEKMEKIVTVNGMEVNEKLEERKRWEQELLRLEQDKVEYEKRKELRKQRKDEVGVARWDAKLRDIQNQISTVKGKVKALSDFITRSNRETEKTTKNLHDTYQKLIADEEKKIKDLENQRDTEVDKKEKEMEELKQETLLITDKVTVLIDQKQERLVMVKEATIQWKVEIPTLIQIPFYVIQYSADGEKRHRLRAPVFARSHEGLVMKIRKAIKGYSLESKINALLRTRSKALEIMLTVFEEKLVENKEAQMSIDQLGMSSNLLASSDFKLKLKSGLDELEGEGWIKPEEKETLLDAYAKS